jgi:hypothetical protein
MRLPALFVAFVLLTSSAPSRGDDSAAEARQIVLRALAAHGIRDVEHPLAMECRYRLTYRKDVIHLLFRGTSAGLPAYFEMREGDKNERMVMCFRTKGSWAVENEQIERLPQGLEHSVFPFVHFERVTWLLPLVQDHGFTLSLLPDAELDGRALRGVKASYSGRPVVHLYFDRAEGTLRKAEMEFGGKPFTRLYEDVRAWDGAEPDEKLLRSAGLSTDGPALLRQLRLHIPVPQKQAEIARLVRQLGDDDFEKREAAASALGGLGEQARHALEAAVRDRDAEVMRQARDLLERLADDRGQAQRLALIRMLARRRPTGALATLEEFAARAAVAEEKVELLGARVALGQSIGDEIGAPGRRLYLPGFRVARKQVWRFSKEEKDTGVLELVDLQLFNRHPDALFEPPVPLAEEEKP